MVSKNLVAGYNLRAERVGKNGSKWLDMSEYIYGSINEFHRCRHVIVVGINSLKKALTQRRFNDQRELVYLVDPWFIFFCSWCVVFYFLCVLTADWSSHVFFLCVLTADRSSHVFFFVENMALRVISGNILFMVYLWFFLSTVCFLRGVSAVCWAHLFINLNKNSKERTRTEKPTTQAHICKTRPLYTAALQGLMGPFVSFVHPFVGIL